MCDRAEVQRFLGVILADPIDTESHRLAVRALNAMLAREPMPAVVALDMVQDATDDENHAAAAIFYAAALSLDQFRPEQPNGEPHSANFNTAIAARAHMLGAHFALALERVREVGERAVPALLWAQQRNNLPARDVASGWLLWCEHARRVLIICREVLAGRGGNLP